MIRITVAAALALLAANTDAAPRSTYLTSKYNKYINCYLTMRWHHHHFCTPCYHRHFC
jgi:hypothetical protein